MWLASLLTITSTAVADFVPPQLVGTATIALPEGAVIAEPVEVVVRLRVNIEGAVDSVELVRGAGAPFDEAVLHSAAQFRFQPGRYLGQPVPVDINYTQRFHPPPVRIPVADPADLPDDRDAVLAGLLRARGTRAPVTYATIRARVDGRDFETISDEAGKFELPLISGTATVSVVASGHRRFRQLEYLKSGEQLSVGYYLDRDSYSPYEVVVTAKIDRTEVARTTLRGRDISQVPGTFGDPFRVVGTLPGVSSMMSLLPFPVVRGSSSGNTGFLIDGVRVPLLFHLLAGPSVIHPEFIDAIEFSPGGFPVEYGGYTGGIVDGKTRSARADERKIDVDLNLFQVGGFVRHPVPFGTATVAGRYGFPGLLISLASPEISLDYWDYQARFDGGSSTSKFTVFVFGANDTLDAVPPGEPDTAEKEPRLHALFHRLDLRFQHLGDGVESTYQLTLGYDGSLSPDVELSSLSATPRIRWRARVDRSLELRLGIDASVRNADLTSGPDGIGEIGLLLGAGNEPSNTLFSSGVLAEAFWRPTDDLIIRPGVRMDGYDDTKTTHGAVDPRVLARYRLLDEGPEVWIKGSAGIFHQPPRFTIPVPGLDELAFQKGLLESAQAMLGFDVVLGDEWSADLQTYFNWMDPIIYDTQVNADVDDLLRNGPQAPPGREPPEPPVDRRELDDRLDELLVPATGRSYGFELLVRRRSASGVSGWLAYTLSRAERLRDGRWQGFDFDRAHIVNVVASVPLPRHWQLGMRAQVQTGRPITTTSGIAQSRTSTFVRFDLRIDKTAVWNDWLLDFYVDIANVVLGAEELAPEQQLRYVLPTVGFRAIF